MRASVFSPRLLAAWIAAALLTFAASLYFGSLGEGGKSGADAVGPSTFSRSAIGYAGIAEILRRLHIPVVKSQYDALAKLGSGGVLVVAEPELDGRAASAVTALLKAPTALLILPKWHGEASEAHRGWLADAALVPPLEADWVLNLAVPGGKVMRTAAAPRWTINALGETPSLDAPVQLITSDRLTPIVGASEGMLVGELRSKGRRLWVLSDPDVIANHGLGRDGNAAFAVALLQRLAMEQRAGSPIVFDETVHGYVSAPASPLMLLFRFPVVIATGLGALALLLLLWASFARFGAPVPAPTALGAGKRGLVENAAGLLEFAGHRRSVVRRYVEASLRDAARRLHAPRGLAGAALLDWLKRVGDARGVRLDCAAIARDAEERSNAAELAAVARAIHHWKGEIIDGPSRDPRSRRSPAQRGEEGRRRAG
jgi:hypothetical protein